MTTAMGTGRLMTSPPLPGEPGGNRALRIALLAVVAAVVVGGLIAVVVGVPAHKGRRSTAHSSIPAPTAQLPSATTAQPSPSESAIAPTSTAPVSSLGGLVIPSGDPQAVLKTSIAAAFVSFTDVVNNMSTTKTTNFTPLTEVAADPLLPAMEDGIAKLYGQGWIEQGRATLSDLTIQTIAPDGQSATLTACEDVSHTYTVTAKTGATIGPQASGAASPRIIDAASLRIRDGRWKVTGLTHPGTC